MEGVLEPDDLSWSYGELNPPPPQWSAFSPLWFAFSWAIPYGERAVSCDEFDCERSDGLADNPPQMNTQASKP